MTLGEAQEHGQKLLRRAGIESRHIDTSLLLAKVTDKERAWVFAHLDDELPQAQASEFMELVSRRAEHVPLVHLTNNREFYGLDFYINEDVLTPRVETETMVELAINHVPKNSRVIDIGTGSGALAIAFAKHRPDCTVVATEVDTAALKIAERNAKTHNVDITLVVSDLFSKINGAFDAVLTNLPYLQDDADLMPEVQKEPAIALFGGADGLNIYRRFLKELPDHLNPAGLLFTECDPWQQAELTVEAAKIGLQPLTEDYFILGFKLEN